MAVASSRMMEIEEDVGKIGSCARLMKATKSTGRAVPSQQTTSTGAVSLASGGPPRRALRSSSTEIDHFLVVC